MWGKYFQSAFTGSLQGSGANVFAVWSYIIAHAIDERVELNARLVAFCIGITEQEVKDCIELFCSPDPNSRSLVEDGKRLIHEGGFSYFIVNWKAYNKKATGAELRAAAAELRRMQRDKKRDVSDTCPTMSDTKNDMSDNVVTKRVEKEEEQHEHGHPDKTNTNTETDTQTVAPSAFRESAQVEVPFIEEKEIGW